jgi:DNA-directed RNA polymerase specialized sigma subunit
MGREEKRRRARVTKHLRRKLGHEPTEEEIEKALAELRETRRKTADRAARR